MESPRRRGPGTWASALVLALLTTPGPLGAREPVTLWERAMEVAGQNEAWLPQTIREREVVTNRQGSVTYHRAGPREWYPLEVRYRMDLEAKIFPLARFRGHVETTVTLSDHVRVH